MLQVDARLLEPVFQIPEGDDYIHEVLEGVRLQFLADAGTGEHDLGVLPVQLFEDFGMSQHGGYDRGDVVNMFRRVFSDIFHYHGAGGGNIYSVFSLLEEFLRSVGYDFRSQCRFRYIGESQPLDGGHQRFSGDVPEFAHVGGG